MNKGKGTLSGKWKHDTDLFQGTTGLMECHGNKFCSVHVLMSLLNSEVLTLS